MTGVGDSSVMRHPQFSDIRARLDSFTTWPYNNINVEEITAAGIFYIGDRAKTACFHCGIQKEDWASHDNPWIEHAWLSADCQFLHDRKGKFFVKAAREICGLSVTDRTMERALSDNSSAPKRCVADDEIWARLDMDYSKILISLGFSIELVGSVIKKQLELKGDDFKYFGDFARAALIAAEETGRPIRLPTNGLGLTEATLLTTAANASGENHLNTDAHSGSDIPCDQNKKRKIPKSYSETKCSKPTKHPKVTDI